MGREGEEVGELLSGEEEVGRSSSGEELRIFEEGVAEKDCSKGFGSKSKSERVLRVDGGGVVLGECDIDDVE